MGGKRAFFQNLLLVVGGFAAAVLVCEVVLRIAGFSAPHFYTFDDTLGHRLLPGARGWYRDEGKAFVEISADGLRDREHAAVKPPNTIRIAVLGDSFAEALQVSREDAFWTVMERQLDSCLAARGERAEVLNFGVSGYGTAQEFLALRNRVWRYDPDIVLLAFVTANDVQDNSKRLQPPDYPRPYFVPRGDSLALDLSFRDNPSYRRKSGALWPARLALMRYSRTFQLLIRAAKRCAAAKRPAPGIAGEEPGLDIAVYSEPSTDEWREAWAITEGVLKSMRDESISHGARLVVATLSNGIQVHPDPVVRRRFMERHGLSELFYPDERIARFCRAEGIEAVTLAPELRRYAEERGAFLHGFEGHTPGTGHWNAEGHREAGMLLANYLCRIE